MDAARHAEQTFDAELPDWCGIDELSIWDG